MPGESRDASGSRRAWTSSITLIGVGVALVGALLAALVGRATGAGWLPAVGLAILLAVGLFLWARDEEKGWGDLGEGIMVSVIVAIALMAVQRDADDRLREATERRDRQLREAEAARVRAAERQGLQLSLTMQPSLRGIALIDRDMRGFFLTRKDLSRADLHGANFAGADLRGSRLRYADLRDANFNDARMSWTDLRRATFAPFPVSASRPPSRTTFRDAYLLGADFRGAALSGIDFTGAALMAADFRGVGGADGTSFRDTTLIRTDFRGAYLAGADLSGATLGGALFCGVVDLNVVRLDKAVYDETTRWPPQFHPSTRGARKVRGGAAWSYEASDGTERRIPPSSQGVTCRR